MLPEKSSCYECGKEFVIDDAGVATHSSEDSPDGIDHDADAHHVPYSLDEGDSHESED